MEAVTEWLAGLSPVAKVIVVSFMPLLELRAGIPYGLLATSLPAWAVIVLAVLSNWLVGPAVYYLLPAVVRVMLRFRWFARFWDRLTTRVQARIHHAIETRGVWGVALFIGLPLPGTGVYTGALGAYLLGMSFPRFIMAATAGILLAALLVSAAVLSGSGAVDWILSRRLLDGH